MDLTFLKRYRPSDQLLNLYTVGKSYNAHIKLIITIFKLSTFKCENRSEDFHSFEENVHLHSQFTSLKGTYYTKICTCQIAHVIRGEKTRLLMMISPLSNLIFGICHYGDT